MIGRRDFIAGLGAASWPLVARAQQPSMPVVGWLQSTSRGANQQFLALFRKGLSEMGYVEGRNVAMELRYAGNELQRLPELAADLVRRRVAIIAALGGMGKHPRRCQQPRLFPLCSKSASIRCKPVWLRVLVGQEATPPELAL
jgi:hypothetical protein